MHKVDIWLLQKIEPMVGKIAWAEAHAFNHKGPINTWPQMDHSAHKEGSSIRVCAPWQGDCLSSHTKEWNRGMVYNVLDGSPC